VVSEVNFEFFGYGNSVMIDHGFGYKTRYAHLKLINVARGMKVKRGDCIGESGNSGRSTGPHLHYEVIYRGNYVNPVNYFDLSMSTKEYSSMVRKRENESEAVLERPSRRLRW
jgi:murein DD-endopeptidase MepM/ murein hydrolase activator NlpD